MTENAQTSEKTQTQIPVKRGRGRPKGSTKISKGVLPTEKTVEIGGTETPKIDKGSPESNVERLNAILKAGGAKYDTLDSEAYRNSLDEMTLNDLHAEATRIGLKPLGDRSLTTRTLMDLFQEENRRFKPNMGTVDATNLDDDKRAILTQIMKDAR